MTPKTAALAFDRVYRIPALIDPVPEALGFYCATLPELVFWTEALFISTLQGLDWGKERVEGYLPNNLTPQQKANNEVETMRFLCSQFQGQIGVTPAIFYHSRQNMEKEFPAGASVVLQATISSIAIVDEESLQWDQVLEFRRDADVRKKYRRLVRWIDGELKTRPPREIEDLIAVRLDDYAWALKKHGIKASLGAISCLLDPKFLGATSAAVAATAVAADGLWAAVAAAGLTVGRAAVSFGTTLIDGLDERRQENYEVAYLYEMQSRLG
jgi:hypothetical protein